MAVTITDKTTKKSWTSEERDLTADRKANYTNQIQGSSGRVKITKISSDKNRDTSTYDTYKKYLDEMEQRSKTAQAYNVRALGAYQKPAKGGTTDYGILDRVYNTVSGGVKSTAGSVVNVLGDFTAPQLTIGEEFRSGSTEAQRRKTLEEKQKKSKDAMHQTADALSAGAAEDIEKAKAGLGTVGQLLVDAGVAGTQMLGDAAVNALLPGSGLMAMGVRAFGGATQQAREEGATENQQLAYGALNAATEVLTEKMFGVFEGIYGKGFLDKSKLAKTVEKAVGKLSGTTAGKILGSMGEEALEEVVAGAVEPAFEYIYGGKGYNEDTASDVISSAIVGGILGGIGGAGNVIGENRYHKGVYGASAEELAQEAQEIGNTSKTAQRIAQRSAEGKKASAKDLKTLVRENQSIIDAMPAEEDRQENGLVSISQHEAENLSSGKKNRIVKTFNDAVAFIRNARENKQSNDKAYWGKVPQKTSERVLADTGVDLTGYNATIDGGSVRHIFNKHGDSVAEDKIGQIAVTEDDIALIPIVIAEYDTVKKGHKDTYGRDTLIFEKKMGDRYITVQAYVDGTKSLRTDTLYIKKEGSQGVTRNAQQEAAPAKNVRNDSPQNPLTDTTIAQSRESVNIEQINNETEEGINGEAGDEGSGGAVRRQDRLGAEEQGGRLAERSRRQKTEQAIAGRRAEEIRAAVAAEGNRLARVSGREMGITDSDERTATLIPKRMWTAQMQKVQQRNAEKGITTWFFTGHFKEAGDEKNIVRGAISPDGKTVYVCADNEKVLFERLNGHEVFHAAVKRNQQLRENVRRKVVQQYGEQELQALVEAYVNLYGGENLNMSIGEIEEEILADAYGGIDIFAGHTYEGATRFTETVKGAVAAEEHKGSKNAAVENDSGGVKYSIQPIIGEKQNYGNGVVLDTNLFDGVSPRNWGKVLNKFVYLELAGKEMVVYDEDGKEETIYLAKENDRVKKDGSNNSHKVLDKLARNGSNNIRALAIVHLSEALETSSYQKTTEEHNHQWMDENGWELRTAYLQDSNGNIYQATLNIANGRDRKILYDINNIRKIDQKNRTADGDVPSTENGRGSLISNSSESSISNPGEKVNGKFSREVDSSGKQLTEKQAAYFKDSKVRDNEGRLLVVYRGGKEDFTVFDRKKSKASNLYGRGFYFTVSKEHAGQYGNVKPYYLNISDPLQPGRTSVSKSEIKAFLKAVEENEDYGLENYGYGATAENVLRQMESRDAFQVIQDINATSIGDLVAAVELFNEVNRKKFDGIITETEIVTFQSNQAKSVDNEAPTRNPDIRYSKEVRSEDLERMQEKLTKVRQQLYAKRKQAAYWKAEATEKHSGTVRPGDVARVSNEVCTEFNSTLEAADIRERMQRLADGMVSGKLKPDQAIDLAVNIAGDIVWHSQELSDPDGAHDYAEIRAYLKKTRIQIGESVRSDMPEYNEFRKRHMGKMNLVRENGVPVDVAYEEMHDRFGEAYFPNNVTHPGDQLRRIAYVVDSMGPIYENPYSYNMAEAQESCATYLLERLMSEETRLQDPTRAEKWEKQIQKERMESKRYVEKAIAREKQKRMEMTDTRTRQALRTEIGKTVRRLDSALRNLKEGSYVPENLQEPVMRFCEIFTNLTYDLKKKASEDTPKWDDHTVFDAQRLAAARAAYEKMKRNGFTEDAVYDEDIDLMLERAEETIGGRRMADLTANELQNIRNIADHLAFLVRNDNEIFVDGKKAEVSALGQGVIDEMKKKGRYSQLIRVTDKNGKAENEATHRLLKEGNLKPVYYFRRLGGTMEKLWQDILQGSYRCGKLLHEADAFAEITREKYKQKDWRDKTVTITDAAGKEVKVNVLDAGYLIAVYKREKTNQLENELEATYHVTQGGFQLRSKTTAQKEITVGGKVVQIKAKAGAENHRMTVEGIGKLTQELNKINKNILPYVDEMVGYLSGHMAEIGNETSLAINGYRKFPEKYYVSIHVAGDTLQHEPGQSKSGTNARYKNRSFTHATKADANKPFVLENFDEMWTNHVSEMCQYVAMAQAQDNILRVMNYQTGIDKEGTAGLETVRQAITNAFGERGEDYLETLMMDLNGGILKDPRASALDRTLTMFKKGSTMASLSVAIQQPSSIARAAAVIHPKYLIGTTAKKGGWEELKKYSGTARLKEIGGFDTNTGRSGAEWLNRDNVRGVRGIVDKWGGKLPEWMDERTWNHIWQAVKNEVADQTGLDIDSEELKQKAGERFDEIIELTQVYDSVLTRSENMRSKETLMKSYTAFMAEPMVTLNMVEDAVYKVKQKEKGAGKHMARTLGAVVVSIILNSFLKAVATAPRDKDKEKTILEKWAEKFTGNVKSDLLPWNYYPILKDLGSVYEGYTVGANEMKPLTEIVDTLHGLIVETDGGRDLRALDLDDVANLLGDIGTVTGRPIKNIWRDVSSIFRTVSGKTAARLEEGTWETFWDAAREGWQGELTMTRLVHRLYDAKSKNGQDKAIENMEILWKRKVRKKMAEGETEADAKKDVNTSMKSSITRYLKAQYQAAETRKEKEKIISLARRVFVGGHQLYNGYDFSAWDKTE